MNTLLKKLAVVATAGTVLSLIGVESASAALLNNRPIPSGASTFQSNSLTTILGPSPNGINSGITNVVTQQSNVALWSAASPNTAQSGVTLIIELAGLADKNLFGIYDANNPNTRIQIFEGDDVGNLGTGLKEGATITFTALTGVDLGKYKVDITEIDSANDGFESLPFSSGIISSSNFGFYLDSTPSGRADTGIFYTEDDKNQNGKPQALVYGGTGSTLSLPGAELSVNPTFEQGKDWILAWEDLKHSSSDKDFNDMVLFVDNVGAAVPEPLTMLGAAAAAGFGAFFKRQTAKKQKKDN